MEIEVRTVHLSKKSWAFALATDYVAKIQPFEKIRFNVIKDEKKFLDKVSPQDRVLVCDERGEALQSRPFSHRISQMRDGGIQKLFIVIGGPFGLPKEVVDRANITIQLSSFVMNQEVALIVLMEQVFRAYTILNNHPYHND